MSASRPRDKRKQHVATGKPHGGARPGAGRPPGSPDILPRGMPAAIKALNLRVPENVTEGQKVLLSETETAILKVMQGKVHGSIAPSVILAARTVREEICGPIAKKVEVDAKVGLASLLDEVKTMEAEEQKPALPEGEKKVLPKAPIIRKKKAAEIVIDAAVGEALSEEKEEP